MFYLIYACLSKQCENLYSNHQLYWFGTKPIFRVKAFFTWFFFLYILWSKLASHVFEFYTQGYICTSWYKSQARSECYSEFINPSAKEFKYVTFYDPELNSLANSCLSPNYCKIYRKRNHEAIIKWSFHIIFWVESPHTKRA